MNAVSLVILVLPLADSTGCLLLSLFKVAHIHLGCHSNLCYVVMQ